MKRLKKKLETRFTNLIHKVKKIEYWFTLGDLDINIFWYYGEKPLIDVVERETGKGLVYDCHGAPIKILKKIINELSEKVKEEASGRI